MRHAQREISLSMTDIAVGRIATASKRDRANTTLRSKQRFGPHHGSVVIQAFHRITGRKPSSVRMNDSPTKYVSSGRRFEGLQHLGLEIGSRMRIEIASGPFLARL